MDHTKRKPDMKATIKYMSELTGFSQATISNALNYKKGVNPDTSKKILEVARELGYLQSGEQNQRKITFVMYKSNGLITDDTPFFTMVLDGFESECRRWGYEMAINYLDRRAADFEKQAAGLLKNTSSAVVLMGAEMIDEDFENFRTAGCLLTTLDYWDEQMMFSGVIINNEDSTRAAVRYLLEKGHREIGYLRGDFRIKAFRQRGSGYRLTLAKAGIPLEKKYIVTLKTTMDGAYHDMLRFLIGKPELPTAFFADNDMIALGAMKALQECGYRIPEDISVIGFDDLPFCEIVSPRLTSLRVPKQEMGKVAARNMIDRMEHGSDIVIKTQICAAFMERDSVRDLSR